MLIYPQIISTQFTEAQMPEDPTRLDYRDPEWVAEQLGIDKNTVYKYLQEGSLPGLQLGRKWLVSERRLADFLERVEREQTARRRDAVGGAHRPFALPERARLHEDRRDASADSMPPEKGDS